MRLLRLSWLPAALAFLAPGPDASVFHDASARSGLHSVITSGGIPKKYVLEVNGSGLCWLDYDQDGWMDLYLVNGSTLANLQGRSGAASRNHLYRNNRNGTFTDLPGAGGAPGKGWGFGCAAADYDNDGRTDLLVTNFGPNVLYRNNGKGFTDVTARAGVGGGAHWHAGAAFADYDLDGFLDVFIPGYLAFDARNPELRTCEYRGVKVHACGPLGYKGAPDALYRNNGDGTFTDSTANAGVEDSNLFFGFQAVWDDFDNDGDADLFVANDSNPNYLYRNLGGGKFQETGVAAGVAYSADGKEMSSMGVAAGDYDRDGWMDLFVTTFANDNYVLFHNDGRGLFTDVSYPSGVGEPTVPNLGWAAWFFDYDNDGLPDIFCANGHVYPEVDGAIRESYRQPMQLLRNTGDGKFVEIPLGGIRPQSARGGAFADYDNDGDLDAAISVMDAKPVLLENRAAKGNNWLRVHLVGSRSNRMAIGSRVKLTAGGLSQHATLRAGESYLSSHDPRLLFGLGSASEAVVTVQWPGGGSDTVNARANTSVEVRQK